MTVYTVIPQDDLNLEVTVVDPAVSVALQDDSDLDVVVQESDNPVILNITPAAVSITSAVTSVNGFVGDVTLDTDDIAEGTVNQYYTDARADARVDLQTGAYLDLSFADTDELAEGPTNLYYTNARAQAQITANTEAFIKADSTDTLTNKTGLISQWTNDAGYLTSETDNQTLSFANPNLSISNGNSVDLSGLTPDLTGYATETWTQALPVSTFTNDAGYLTSETDSQTLSFSSPNLTISNGNSVNISAINTGYATETFVTTSINAIDYPVDSVNGQTDTVVLDTDDISEGTTNQYYTDTRSRSAISLTSDSSALTYNSATGIFTYTDPTGSPGPASHLEIEVRNTSGSTIPANSAVYISGVSGNNDLIELAVNTGSNPAMGVTLSSIPNNSNGIMIIGGEIGSFDTGSYSENDILYLSNVAGELTNVRPSLATEFIQNVGRVVRSHASNGTIIVQGAGRYNDVPNLAHLNVFIGNLGGVEKRQLTYTDILNTPASQTLSLATNTLSISDGNSVDLSTIAVDETDGGTF